MVGEATLIFETEAPIPFTCAEGAGIAKGTLLELTDPMTVVAVSGADKPIAGIAAEEKVASDGRTKIAVYRRGIFKMLAGESAILIGSPLTSHSVVNEVILQDAANTHTLGRAYEAASDTETLIVDLNPMAILHA